MGYQAFVNWTNPIDCSTFDVIRIFRIVMK